MKVRYRKTNDIHVLYFIFCMREGLNSTEYESLKKFELIKDGLIKKYMV